MRFAVIRRTGFVSFSAVITFLTSSATPTTASADSGIAARYPGDKNIGSDPNVILADDFESYTSPSQLTSKWNDASQQQNLRIATEPGNYYAGAKALEMTLPISSAEVLNNLSKNISPEQDVLFIRAYAKFDPGFSVTGSGHNGLRISGHYPGGSGVPAPPDGTGFFSFALQHNIQGAGRPGELQPGYNHVYAYWPHQRTGDGDHWYSDGWVIPFGAGDWLQNPAQYPDFSPIPNWQPERGKWYCYEFMVKANTVGKNDGEVAFWIDGRLAGKLTDLFIQDQLCCAKASRRAKPASQQEVVRQRCNSHAIRRSDG